MNTIKRTELVKACTASGVYMRETVIRVKQLDVLNHGTCEGLKAGIHATTLALAAVMGLYNAAAWLRRREQHLAVNTILYAMLIAWEREHVTRHLVLLREQVKKPETELDTAA